MSETNPIELIRETYRIVESNAYHSQSIDWKRKWELIENLNHGARFTIQDAHFEIVNLLRDLNDNHSHLLTIENKTQRFECDAPIPESRILSDGNVNFGYINIPGFVERKSLSELDYANKISAGLIALDETQIAGWIVDLRNNDGGNMWPMLSGLAPLLCGPVVGFFRNNRNDYFAWKIGKANVSIDDGVVFEMPYPYPTLKQPEIPLAILTSQRTCSSGEAILVALKGLDQSRQFGQATSGLSTANEGFSLSDASELWLTTAIFVDRNRNEYSSKISPDEKTEEDSDCTIGTAITWIIGESNINGKRES